MPGSRTPIKSRGWVFTINNPTETDKQQCEAVIDDGAQYIIFGEEVGEEGTCHFQGYLWYPNSVHFSRVKRLLPRAHIEKQRGNNRQAIDYCKKDGVFREFGTPPENNNQKSKWQSIIQLAEDGKLEELKSDFPRVYFQYHEKIKSMRVARPMVLQGDLTHEWWYGPTGTGKSRKLWQDFPMHYPKKKNKWWDGYNEQPVVAIEEWSPTFHMLASELKIWADRYPFQAEIKGGTLPAIRPMKIIVISNYTIDQCFPVAEDANPLKRRFKVIHFPGIFGQQEEYISAVADDFIIDDINRFVNI